MCGDGLLVDGVDVSRDREVQHHAALAGVDAAFHDVNAFEARDPAFRAETQLFLNIFVQQLGHRCRPRVDPQL